MSAEFAPRTADEDLLCCPPAGAALDGDDRERLARINAELEAGFATLASLGPAVSVFGSARMPRTDPDYDRARLVSRLLGEAGVATIAGGGPGIMEAANRGARDASATSVGLNIELPLEARVAGRALLNADDLTELRIVDDPETAAVIVLDTMRQPTPTT